MLGAYGVDVLDPAVSTRRVAVLVDRLPPHAREGGELWSTEADLLALLVDHVAMLTWVTLRAHGARNVARPRPLPRPAQPGKPAPQRAGPGPGPATPGEGQPVKHGTWAGAITAIAGLPGVQVDRRG